MSCQTSKLKLTWSWSEHVFWLNALSTAGEKHLFQTDQHAILKILEIISNKMAKKAYNSCHK